MPRACLTCASPERAAIDAALVAPGAVIRGISRRFSVSADSLARHRVHVKTSIVRAAGRREERTGATLLERIEACEADARAILRRFMEDRDHRGAVVALKQLLDTLRTLHEIGREAGGDDLSGQIEELKEAFIESACETCLPAFRARVDAIANKTATARA